MRPASHVVVAASMIAASALGLIAQQGAPPVFRIGTELVMVDLIVTDRSGRFVDDLRPGEVQVFENGRPRNVESLVLVSGHTNGPSSSDARRGVAPDLAIPPTPGSVGDLGGSLPATVGIVVDLASTPADQMLRVREALGSTIARELPDDATVMIATLWQGITVHLPFTSDREAMAAAVASLPAPIGGQAGEQDIRDYADAVCGQGGAPVAVGALARTFASELEARLQASIEHLSALVRSLSAVPGRKHLVLYSAGYPLDPVGYVIDVVTASLAACGLSSGAAAAEATSALGGIGRLDGLALQGLIDRANRAQVSFYTIEPRGLVVTSIQAKDAISARATLGGAASGLGTASLRRTQEYLRTLAADTGGRAFINTNDLSEGIRRAWRDGSEYYLLGYRPAGDVQPGEFQRIEVRVARPGVTVTHRRGYYPATEREETAADIGAALNRPDAFDREGFDVEVDVEIANLHVVVRLPPRSIAFDEVDGRYVARVTIHATLRDEAGRLVSGEPLFGHDVTVNLSADQLDDALAIDGIDVPIDVALPAPGTYRLTVAARDSRGWLAAKALEVTVEE